MPRRLKPLESSIQRSVIEYAKKRGCLTKKLSVQGSMGNTGWPDYMIMRAGRLFFMEFKRPGGKLTPLQEQIRSLINKELFNYYVVDSTEQGKNIIDQETI